MMLQVEGVEARPGKEEAPEGPEVRPAAQEAKEPDAAEIERREWEATRACPACRKEKKSRMQCYAKGGGVGLHGHTKLPDPDCQVQRQPPKRKAGCTGHGAETRPKKTSSPLVSLLGEAAACASSAVWSSSAEPPLNCYDLEGGHPGTGTLLELAAEHSEQRVRWSARAPPPLRPQPGRLAWIWFEGEEYLVTITEAHLSHFCYTYLCDDCTGSDPWPGSDATFVAHTSRAQNEARRKEKKLRRQQAGPSRSARVALEPPVSLSGTLPGLPDNQVTPMPSATPCPSQDAGAVNCPGYSAHGATAAACDVPAAESESQGGPRCSGPLAEEGISSDSFVEEDSSSDCTELRSDCSVEEEALREDPEIHWAASKLAALLPFRWRST
jgi:hypothetical protein